MTAKLFADNEDWIFEHGHATSHENNVAQGYLAANVSDFLHKDDVTAKLDDLWCIERL
jgi:hypothetical protein